MLLSATDPASLQKALQCTATPGGLARVVPLPGGGYFAQAAPLSSPREKLSDEQARVYDFVTKTETGDALVIAGPGAGKTGTLVACLVGAVQAGAAAEKLVAISFTNNSAAELKVRLCQAANKYDLPALHRVHVSTFHAWVAQLAALRIEPWTYPPIGLKTASLALALHLRNPDTANHCFTNAEVAAAERHFEGCETFEAMEKRNFNRISAKGENHTGFNNLKVAAAALEPDMANCQISTFGTLMKSGAALVNHLSGDDLQWLFVDEAQDLNAPQADFIAALQKQTGCRLFAIADDDQGIYKFRGASNQFLRDFEGCPGTTKFILTRNFRSTKPIVGACLNWIKPNWETPAAKELYSERDGLSVVLLTAANSENRGRHAKIILDACRKRGLINSLGEVAGLGFAPGNPDFDLKLSEIPYRMLAEAALPIAIFEAFTKMCLSHKWESTSGDWHHNLWSEFLGQVTSEQKGKDDTLPGYPGLDDLYAALEVIRRLEKGWTPSQMAEALREISDQFRFMGERPEPNYQSDEINYLSLHSSKGMEFPVVWITGGAYVYAVNDKDKEGGLPNLLGELGAWAKNALGIPANPATNLAKITEDSLLREKRRLLYVGMSRATDLLLISAPLGRAIKDQNYKAIVEEAMTDVDHKIIYTDEQAKAFAAQINSNCRNSEWSPPHRYRVESFTSLTRQPLPSERQEVEIPRNREYPCPQSNAAMTGDHFHRIMHLLCLQSELVQQRLRGEITDEDLIAKVSSPDLAKELKSLKDYLSAYFSDMTNEP